MANKKISQLTPKGSNLSATDLLEISEFDGSGYITKSITGQEIIDGAGGGTAWGDITGTLSDQHDLQIALNNKFDDPTGDATQYLDGAGTPTTFPTMLSADKMVTVGRNATGSTLYKGTIVYISGSTGNRPNFVKAQANSEATSAGTFGVIESDIPNNSDGNCVTIGTIDNLDTRTSATHPFTIDTLADGDTIYLSPLVAGYVTNVKPSAPYHLVYIGKVVRTSPTNGTIVYRIQNGYELDEIHDVSITSVANNDLIQYDSATSLWKNRSLSTAGIQPTLVSGTNIKTIEGQSILGSGNIDLTKSDVGLANVDNTSDANKPVSTATQTALNAKENTITAGTTSQYYRGDKTFQTLDKTAVGLGNVDNTSDANKPISTATQTALNAKQDTLVSGTNIKTVNSTSLLGSGNVSVGVTSVSGTSPISSTGGATPAISIATADTTTTGALSSTDWNTFNGKQNALTLTTTGTSGAATLVGSTLNVPQYSGGGGLQGLNNVHNGFDGVFIATDASITASNTASFTSTSNILVSNPFTPHKTMTCQNLRVNVTTIGGASGLSRILIYSDLNGLPDQKLFESTDLDISTLGIKTVAVTFTFQAGVTYWLSYYTNSNHVLTGITAASLVKLPSSFSTITGSPNTNATRNTTFGSAPNTYTFSSYGTGSVARIFIY